LEETEETSFYEFEFGQDFGFGPVGSRAGHGKGGLQLYLCRQFRQKWNVWRIGFQLVAGCSPSLLTVQTEFFHF
jgi:hypothetical protein